MLPVSDFILLALFGLLPFTLLVVSIADLMNREFTMWEKILWMMLIVFFIIIGPVIYLVLNKGTFHYPHKKQTKDLTL